MDLSKWRDERGLLCRLQFDGRKDGGDSLHKTSHAAIYTRDSILNSSLVWALVDCNTAPGVWVRNPDPKYWYSKANTRSRDQLRAILGYLVVDGSKSLFGELFLEHCKRLLLFTSNTRNNGSYPTLEEYNSHYQEKPWDGYKWKMPDITLFNVWALYIRGLRLLPLWPLLVVFDLQRLISSIINLFTKDNDQANNLGEMLAAKASMDTPVMWLARKIAKRYLLARLTDYFTQEGEPPLHELAAPLIKEL